MKYFKILLLALAFISMIGCAKTVKTNVVSNENIEITSNVTNVPKLEPIISITPTNTPTPTSTPIPTPTKVPRIMAEDVPEEGLIIEEDFPFVKRIFEKYFNESIWNKYLVFTYQTWEGVYQDVYSRLWYCGHQEVDEDSLDFDSVLALSQTLSDDEEITERTDVKYFIQTEEGKDYLYLYNESVDLWSKNNVQNMNTQKDLKIYNLYNFDETEDVVFEIDESQEVFKFTIKRTSKEINELIKVDLDSFVKPYFEVLKDKMLIFDVIFYFDMYTEELSSIKFVLKNPCEDLDIYYMTWDFFDIGTKNVNLPFGTKRDLMDFADERTLAVKYQWQETVSYEELKEFFKISNEEALNKLKEIVETYTLKNLYEKFNYYEDLSLEDKAILYIFRQQYYFTPVYFYDYIGFDADHVSEDVFNLAESWR